MKSYGSNYSVLLSKNTGEMKQSSSGLSRGSSNYESSSGSSFDGGIGMS